MESILNNQLSLVEATCLALISQGSTHGYDIAKRFHPNGDIGEVFTQTNPVVYRALKSLEAAQLVKSTDALGVRKQLKFALSMTGEGDRMLKSWLNAPATHIRDLRTEFLVKLHLRELAGMNQRKFIAMQRDALDTVLARLLANSSRSAVAIWRREQARAVARFLDELAGEESPPVNNADREDSLQLSARNQLHAKVISVKHGGVLSTVKLALDPGQTMTATITREATDALALAPGTAVLGLCKATDVLVARNEQR
jgi:molybdopterin-binding protein